MELFDLVRTLAHTYGPAGDEAGIRAVIADMVRPYADDMRTDVLGNLIVHKKGAGPRVMFSAHMDAIGLIVTHIEKNGYLRIGKVGGVSPQVVAYTPVRFQNGVRGVIVPEEKAEFGTLKLDECYVDIGAEDKETAESMV